MRSRPGGGVRRRSRLAASVVYGVQGMGFAVVLTNIPNYERRLGIGDDVITLAILGVCLCAGTGSALSELIARRIGAPRTALAGLTLAALALTGMGLAGTWPVFFMAIGAYGLALGTVDASMNMVGIAVEREYHRSLLSSFYAANAAGGVAGALLVSAVALAGSSLTTALLAAAILIMSAVIAARRDLTPSGRTPRTRSGGTPTESMPDIDAKVAQSRAVAAESTISPGTGSRQLAPQIAVSRRAIAALGLAMLAFPVADSSVSSWSSTFLRDVLASGAVFAPWGYAAYQATLIGSRLLGDRWVERFGRVSVVRVGAVVGAAGFGVVAMAPSWPVAVIGLAATGLGLGVVAPMAFQAAGDRAREAASRTTSSGREVAAVPDPVGTGPRADMGAAISAATDRAVARLNVFTYAGAVLGGVLTGVFATAHHLRLGFVVLAALAAVSAALAGQFRGERHTLRTWSSSEPKPSV